MSNSLAAVHPELIAEWSEKNLPLTPDSITFGSNKKVWWKAWWKCKTCGYEWNTLISTRSGDSKCPCCSGYTFIKGRNDPKSTHPQIAKEWSEKNYPLQPDEVNAKSRKNAWWQCRYGHSWSMKINECTVLGKGCRICEQEYVSEGYKVVCKIKEVENNTRVILCDLLNKRKL